MAQMKTYSFTSAAAPVNVDIDVGFDVAFAELINETGQGSSANPGVVKRALWSDTMANAAAALVTNTDGAATDESSFITSAGFSMITQGATYGTSISGFTNANPGVISVSDAEGAGIVAGDIIQVSGLADDGSGTSLNGQYTVASVTGNNVTLTTDTSSGYSAYVSGGNAFRVQDANGNPVPIVNRGKRLFRIGTGLQAASSVIHVVMWGKNSVV